MHENTNDKTLGPNYADTTPVRDTAAFERGVFADLNQEIARLKIDSSSKEEAGHKAKMLARYAEFRIVLITMKEGSRWENHKTPSRIFVQTLQGHIRFHTPSGAFDVRPGQLLALDPGVVHSVDSPEESAFLLILSAASQK